MISVVLLGPEIGAQTTELAHTSTSCPADWGQEAFGRRQPLPFDPLTLQVPSFHVDLLRLRERRWWAEALVNTVVAAGLLAADRAAPATEWTESFMRRPGLTFGLPFDAGNPQNAWQVRLQLKVKRGAPHMGVVVTW